jgi:diacylglycerol O-acyltransferase
MLNYYPVSIPYHGSALNITVQSYAGSARVRLTACRRVLSQAESYELIANLRAALREIQGFESVGENGGRDTGSWQRRPPTPPLCRPRRRRSHQRADPGACPPPRRRARPRVLAVRRSPRGLEPLRSSPADFLKSHKPLNGDDHGDQEDGEQKNRDEEGRNQKDRARRRSQAGAPDAVAR